MLALKRPSLHGAASVRRRATSRGREVHGRAHDAHDDSLRAARALHCLSHRAGASLHPDQVGNLADVARRDEPLLKGAFDAALERDLPVGRQASRADLRSHGSHPVPGSARSLRHRPRHRHGLVFRPRHARRRRHNHQAKLRGSNRASWVRDGRLCFVRTACCRGGACCRGCPPSSAARRGRRHACLRSAQDCELGPHARVGRFGMAGFEQASPSKGGLHPTEGSAVRPDPDVAAVAVHQRGPHGIHRCSGGNRVADADLAGRADDVAPLAQVHREDAGGGANNHGGVGAGAHRRVAEGPEDVDECVSAALDREVTQGVNAPRRGGGGGGCCCCCCCGGR
mmetsp:Transcript_2486/g.9826  ORF Transcript_2486/g.9826 Transcript_2486/m.9826 type:complete len:340 (-) Transcript_2486:1484-2503(-)